MAVPTPSSLAAVIVPPCRSTTGRALAEPIPVPALHAHSVHGETAQKYMEGS